MKILMVTGEGFADRRYGLGKSLLPLVEELAKRSHEVRYLTRNECGIRSKRWIARLNRFFLPLLRRFPGLTSQPDFFLSALLERLNVGRLAAKVARHERYLHVHLHDPWLALGFCISSITAWRRPRWGVTEHGFGCYAMAFYQDGGPLGTWLMRFMRNIERRVLLRAHWVICPTALARAQLARDLAVHPVPGSWHVLPHGRPSPRLYSRPQARQLLGWSNDRMYALSVGRIIPLKNFDLLLRAAARLDQKYPLQIVILGDGDRAQLAALARDLRLQFDVIFDVTDDVGLYLSAADLYVSTSATESFGMANLEALCAGAASICTCVGGVPEVVGSAARLVPVSEPDVADAIRELTTDPALRARMGLRARARGERWPTFSEICTRYEMVLRGASSD